MPRSLDELGPVDWVVIEYPGPALADEVATAIVDLVESEVIRVLDLVVVRRDADGDIDAREHRDLGRDEIGALLRLDDLTPLLSTDDVTAISQAIRPGAGAACLVWENTWATAVTAAARRHGGQVVASGRIPARALLASLDAEMTAIDLGREEGPR